MPKTLLKIKKNNRLEPEMFWLYLAAALILGLYVWRTREGMSYNANELTQIHQGKLNLLEEQLSKVDFTPEQVYEINQLNKKQQDDITEFKIAMLQQNANRRKNAYPQD